MAGVTPNGKLLSSADGHYKDFSVKLARELGLENAGIIQKEFNPSNFFFVKDPTTGGDIMLIGKNVFAPEPVFSRAEIREITGVQDVIKLPVPHYMLDRAIRPLDKGRVLVFDNKIVMKELLGAMANTRRLISNSGSSALQSVHEALASVFHLFHKHRVDRLGQFADQISDILVANGLRPISVPAAIRHRSEIKDGNMNYHYLSNFLDAIVQKKKNGDLVYITNKSRLNEYCGITDEIAHDIGYGFEDNFAANLVKAGIKKENIHFIDDGNGYLASKMEKGQGGLHWRAMEVPR